MRPGGSTSPLERWIARLQSSWLQVLVLVNKDTASTSAGVLASEFISFLQLLAVPVAVVLEIRRRTQGVAQTAMKEVLFGLSVVNPDSIKQVFGETIFVAIFVLAMLSVSAFVVMALVVGFTVASKTAKHSPLLLRTLRATAKLSATALFLPWTSLLLQSLGCDGNLWWGENGVECYGALHTTIAVVVILLLPFFIGASLSVASVYIDRNPVSEQLDARSHGRADVLLLIVKMMLTALLTFGTTTAPEWLLLGLLFVAGGLWLYLFATMVPFASLPMNAAHVGMASAFLSASTAAVIAWATNGQEDVGLLVVLGTPLAGVMGFTAAYSRFNASITVDDPYTIASMWTVVLWTRERLRAAASFTRRSETLHSVMLASSGGEGGPIPVALSAEAARWGLTVDRTKSLSQQLEGAATTGIEALEDVFSANGIAHSVASSFWAATSQLSHYKERQALTLARGISRAFDIDFFFYQGLQNMQSSDGSASKRDTAPRGQQPTMSVVDRVLFDQHKVTALQSKAECYAVHVLLMKHVATRSMDIAFLHRHLGARLDDAMRTANNSFDSMLRINSESPEALNSAAEFHLQLAGNTTRASELFKRASRIEENNRRAKERKLPHAAFGSIADDDLSPTDEQNASFTISTDRARLGEIVGVNAAAIRMFGSSSLLGSNIDCILPNGPLREVHDSFLAKFVQTGTSAFLDSTRILIAQQSAGYLFPIRFRIFETPPSAEDMRPKLTGLIAPVTSDEGFLVVGDESYDFTILSVCLKTASVLQRPVDALSEQNVPAALIFPELFGSAGQGGMVDDCGPSALPSMRRVDSRASQGVDAGFGPQRRRPGSARSHGGGSVAPASQSAADDGHGAAPTAGDRHQRGGPPAWLEGFPQALLDSFKAASPVNLFVPALLTEDDFEGNEGSDGCDTDSLGAFSADGAGAGAGAGAGMPGATSLSRVRELEEDEVSGDDGDSTGAAQSDSEGGDVTGSDSDGDPATRRVEPHVIPVTVRCYALPKRTATMPTGIVVTWSHAAGDAQNKLAFATSPASRAPTKTVQLTQRTVPLPIAAPAEADAPASDDFDGDAGTRGRGHTVSGKRHGKGVIIISPSTGEPMLPGAASQGSEDTDLTLDPHGHSHERGSGAAMSPGGQRWNRALDSCGGSAVSRGNARAVGGVAMSPQAKDASEGLVSQRQPQQQPQDGSDEDEDAGKVQHAMIRRRLKRTLDLMTKAPSPGVRLLRRALWMTMIVFFVLGGATLGALGPWKSTISLHAEGIRHAGHVIEHLHHSSVIVEIMSSETELWAVSGRGWPVASYEAVVDAMHTMPARLDEAIHVFYSDIQSLGGPLVDLTTTANRVTVVSESGQGVEAEDEITSNGMIPGRRRLDNASGMPQHAWAGPRRALIPGSSSGGTLASLSLFDSLQAVQQALEALSKQNRSTLASNDPDAVFILENARHRIGDVVNETLEAKALDLGAALGEMEAIERFTFAIVISITVFGQLVVSIVASGYLWREQTALMSIFYNIPSKLARAMASRAEAHLRKHRKHTANLTGGHDDGVAGGEDSDDSVERQREEGEEIRWQLLVERLSRLAQEDYAAEQATAQGLSTEAFLKKRRVTRTSISLDALEASKVLAVTAADSSAPGSSKGKSGSSIARASSNSRPRRASANGRTRRGSDSGAQNGRSKRGDMKLRAEMSRERQNGIHMQDSTGTRLLLLLLSLAPSLLIVGWFATVYSLDIAMHQRVLVETERLLHLQQLSIWSGELTLSVSSAAFLPSARGNQTQQQILMHKAADERISVSARMALVQNGGQSTLSAKLQHLKGTNSPPLTPLGEADALQAVINLDGCSAVVFGVHGTFYQSQNIVNNATCHTAHSGVLSRGIRVGIASLLAHSRAVDSSLTQRWREEASLAALRANASQAAIHSTDVDALVLEVTALQSRTARSAETVLQLYDPWLRAGLLALEQGIADGLATDISSTWELQRNITIVFMVVFVFSVVFVFAPRLAWVERIVAAARRMLLVVPDDVLVGFPLLGEAVKELETALSSTESVASKLGSNARKRRSGNAVGRQAGVRPAGASVAPSRSIAPGQDGTVITTNGSNASFSTSLAVFIETPSEASSRTTEAHQRAPAQEDATQVDATLAGRPRAPPRGSTPLRYMDSKAERLSTDLSAVNSDEDAGVFSDEEASQAPIRGIEVGNSPNAALTTSVESFSRLQGLRSSATALRGGVTSPAAAHDSGTDHSTGNPTLPELQ